MGNSPHGGLESDSLKVHDVCSLTKQEIMQIHETYERLNVLCKEYFQDASNLFAVDELKRRFLAELGNYVEHFAKVRSFKSGSHVYLEDQRKRLKSDAIEHMVKSGEKRTVAEVMVYSSQYYKERFDLLEKLKAWFIKYEFKYDYYNRVLDSMIQSISVGGKEYQHSKHS